MKGTGIRLKTNSKNGMRSTEGLKSKDICAIIKACKQAGVREFRYRGLELKFLEVDPPHLAADQRQPEVGVQIIERPTQTPEKIEMTTEDEEALREMRTQQLMMEDPSAFEQYIADGMMEKNGLRGVQDVEANH